MFDRVSKFVVFVSYYERKKRLAGCCCWLMMIGVKIRYLASEL